MLFIKDSYFSDPNYNKKKTKLVVFIIQKKILGNFLFSLSLSSALSGLTSVFGMGTGVPHLLSLPRKYYWEIILWKLRYCVHQIIKLWLNPRSISTGQLKMSPFFHLQPINQIVFLGSYYIRMGKLISKEASRLDAFSGYPFQT